MLYLSKEDVSRFMRSNGGLAVPLRLGPVKLYVEHGILFAEVTIVVDEHGETERYLIRQDLEVIRDKQVCEHLMAELRPEKTQLTIKLPKTEWDLEEFQTDVIALIAKGFGTRGQI